MSYKLFSSESVSEGHPDKIADQISDAVLDAIIAIDPDARVACETLIKNNTVFIAGEITTDAQVDVEQVARNVLFDIGYNDAQLGIDSKSCSVVTLIGHQSSDIAIGVDATDVKELGAGDQGTMFGFACTETDVLMPLPIYYAHKLMQKHAEVRKNGTLKWLRPDAKTQLTVRYVDYQPVSIDIIVFSTQHAPEISLKELKEAVIETIIKPVLPTNLITTATKFFINHTGAFIIGGPVADSGLTGRKIIVDTYGGIAKHGGGAFSGKDPTKVDRSGAYMARHIAKSIVAAGYADRCEIQVSYAIGAAKPVAIHLECFGTNKLPEESILQLINTVFDFRPARIIEYLQLQNPIYRATSNYGHFGRAEFSWERVAILSNKIHQNAISW